MHRYVSLEIGQQDLHSSRQVLSQCLRVTFSIWWVGGPGQRRTTLQRDFVPESVQIKLSDGVLILTHAMNSPTTRGASNNDEQSIRWITAVNKDPVPTAVFKSQLGGARMRIAPVNITSLRVRSVLPTYRELVVLFDEVRPEFNGQNSFKSASATRYNPVCKWPNRA